MGLGWRLSGVMGINVEKQMDQSPDQTRKGRPPKLPSEQTSQSNSEPLRSTDPEITILRPPMDDMEEVRGNSLQEFIKKVHAARAAKPVEQAPPAPSPRQAERTNAELEAGRRRVAYAAEQASNRPRVVRDKTEGSTTPVYRPGDHVPNLDSKDPGRGSQGV